MANESNACIVISIEAFANIESNTRWWAENRSVDQARRWQECVIAQLTGLPETASHCSHSREHNRPHFPYPLWDKLLGLGRGNSHRDVFPIMNNTIYVFRFSHPKDKPP